MEEGCLQTWTLVVLSTFFESSEGIFLSYEPLLHLHASYTQLEPCLRVPFHTLVSYHSPNPGLGNIPW